MPILKKSDMAWFAIKRLTRISHTEAKKVYNFIIDTEQKPLKVHLAGDASADTQNWWFYAASKDLPACNMPGCSGFYTISNNLVTGDLSRQQITERLIQDNFTLINRELESQ